jgi:hypothetical protein
MKINRDNYEAYFLDYHEGQLSQEMVKEVLLFVEHNPDLKELLDAFEPLTLDSPEHIIFKNKSSLKKNEIIAAADINELNVEEYLVNETEGLLDAKQLATLEAFINSNPQFDKDRRLYSLTHLEVENDIVFELKDSLRKKAIAVGTINEETFETFMARELEGDLNVAENLELAEFMKYNPHLEPDRKLFELTKLNVDNEIVFEDKKKLKQSVTTVRRMVYYTLSAAASFALIMSLYFLLNRNDISNPIARRGKIKNTSGQQITQPEVKNPENQVAVNSGKSISSGKSRSKNKLTNPNETNTLNNPDNAIKNQSEEPLAAIDNHEIMFLSAKSAQQVSSAQYVDPQFLFIRSSQMYINERYEFYYNLKLAEELQYAELNTNDKNPARTIFRAITGRNNDAYAANRKTPEAEEKSNISLWTFAELGVKTYNSVTSSDVELKLEKDEQGKVVSYGLEGGIIDFEKDVKK